jgi:hypothetical protein
MPYVFDPTIGIEVKETHLHHDDCNDDDCNDDDDDSQNYVYDPTTGNEVKETQFNDTPDCDNYVYDPSTGNLEQQTIFNAVADSEFSDSESCASSNEYNTHKNKLSVLFKDLYNADCKCQCVNLAVVYNYNDDKINESNFSEVRLGEINIDYTTLVKIFFKDVRKGFSHHVLGTIWKGIKNFSLASVVLDKYEEQTGIDRNEISAVKKVRLHKECAFANLNSVIRRAFGLTQNEYNCALGSVDVRDDGNICTSIVINLYFPSLSYGIKVVMRFAVSCVPRCLIGKFSSEENYVYDFTNVCSEKKNALIVFDDCKKPVCRKI